MEVFGRGTKREERDYPKILATTLNGQWPRNFLGWLAGIPEDRPSGIRTSSFRNASRETRDAAVGEFLDTLRRLADQWIESGRGQLGEQPWSRNVFWVSDTYQERIDRTLRKFMARNPPPNEFGSDGRLARLEAVSHLWLPKPLAWPFPEPELEDTLARARDFAISEFLKFLASSCPQRLFKCDGRRGCGAYFVRTRAPRKETLIYHGTFCENCKNAGEDKKRRTEEIRSNLAESLWKLAAHHWPNWNPKIHGQSRSKWVAEMMNEKLVKKGICKTGKWVTQNRVMIEAEVERKNHAKG